MSRFKISRPFLLIIYFNIIGIIVFSLFRLSWLLIYSDFITNTPIGEILTAFTIGLRFDQIVILISLIPFLLIYPWIKISDKYMRYFVTGYYSIIYLIFFLLLLADIRFYHYFDTHLNFLAIEYINEGATFYNLILSESYFYLFIGLSVLSTFLIIIVKRKILNKIEKTPLCLSISSQTIYFIVFIVLFGIGLRGRLSTSPLDWGIAYISNNRFINQLALNGIYTLGKNLTETNNDPRLSFVNPNERFEFIPIKDCLNDVKAILTQPNQRWLNDNSLLRVIEQPKKLDFNPNIIIVIMESWSANLTGALGDSRHLTPNFDRLSKSGVLFNNFYSP